MTYDTTDEHLQRALKVIRRGALRGDTGDDEDLPAIGLASTLVKRVNDPCAPVPPAGTILRGTWRLSSWMGAGSFGVVYGAVHRSLQREDAVKFLHPHLARDQDIRARFRREAVTMARLCGEHLVQVHDCGEHEGLPFLIMERLHGHALDERLRRDGPLPLQSFRRLSVGILRGLAEIHAQGVVHRDIKPANIFVLAHADRVKLLDFGLALNSSASQAGTLAGTPYYMAPELFLAPDAVASVSTDIYSAGVVFYQMLTGRLPFTAAGAHGVAELLQRITTGSPASPRALGAGVSVEVDELIMRAISHDPAKRPSSSDELIAVLEGKASSANPSSPRSTDERLSKWRKIAKKGLGNAALPRLIVIGLAVISLVSLSLFDNPEQLDGGTKTRDAQPNADTESRFIARWSLFSNAQPMDEHSRREPDDTLTAESKAQTPKLSSSPPRNLLSPIARVFTPTQKRVKWNESGISDECGGTDCGALEIDIWPSSEYFTKLDRQERVFGTLLAADIEELPVLTLDVVNMGSEKLVVSELGFDVLSAQTLEETILSAEYIESNSGPSGLFLNNFGRSVVKNPQLDLWVSLDCTDATAARVYQGHRLDDFASSYSLDVRDDAIATLVLAETASGDKDAMTVETCFIGSLHYQTHPQAASKVFHFMINGTLGRGAPVGTRAKRSKLFKRGSVRPQELHFVRLDGTAPSLRSLRVMHEIPPGTTDGIAVQIGSTVPAILHLRVRAKDMSGTTLVEREIRFTIRH
jgi:serine/threonine protein kinase